MVKFKSTIKLGYLAALEGEGGKQVKRDIQWQMKNLKRVFNITNDATILTDLNGIIVELNGKAKMLFGSTRSADLLKRSILELVKHEDHNTLIECHKIALKKGVVRDVECHFIRANGTEFLCETSMGVLSYKENDPAGFITIVKDATERKNLEYSLGERVRELECLYGITRLAEKPRISLNVLYQEVANLLREACGYPRIGSIRIVYGDKEFKSDNFKTTEWKISSDFRVGRTKAGMIEINYLDADIFKEPYLSDAVSYWDAVAKRLGEITENKKREEALLESEANLARSQRIAHLGNWDLNVKANTSLLSDEYYRIFGLSPRETGFTQEEFLSQIHPDDREFVQRKTEESFYQSAPHSIDYRIILPDGSERVVHSDAEVLFDEAGEPIRMFGIIQDITERKKREEALQKSEEFSSNLLNKAPIPIISINQDTSIRYVNPAFESLTGFSSLELLDRKTPYPWWPGGASKDTVRDYGKLINKRFRREERLFQKKNGQQFRVETTAQEVHHNKELEYYLESWINITEQKQLRDNIDFYITQIISAQEEERKRISRELHDESIQPLFSVLTDIEAMRGKGKRLSKDAIKQLENLKLKIDSTMRKLRRFSHELRPDLLDRFGLIPAVELLVEELNEVTAIDCCLERPSQECKLSPETTLMLFRIIQESLRNIEKHSQASEAKVIIDFTDAKVKATIIDNGIGFKVPQMLNNLARKRKLGLLGMHDRARLVNGDFCLESRPGVGTKISIEILV